MEQIIKYELIINKALRSALEYDKLDEQINELQQVDIAMLILPCIIVKRFLAVMRLSIMKNWR